MKKVCALAIIVFMVPGSIVAQMKPVERISLSVNAVHGLFGEVQADFSMKFDAFEFSVKPGYRLFYVQEGGVWTPGRGYSLRLSFHQYITPSLYLGLAVPAAWSLDFPHSTESIPYIINLGVAPIFGWRHKLAFFLFSVELGAGIGAQAVFIANPWRYAIQGWFPLHVVLGVGVAFGRKKTAGE